MTEVELLMSDVLCCRRVDLYAGPVVMDDAQRQRFHEMKRQLAEGHPVQYILGKTEFMGFSIRVNSSVLIPRPETEIMVEYAANLFNKESENLKILDIGTGSGCIAIALAKAFPSAKITAVDISQEALSTALQNTRENLVSENVSIVCHDMMAFMEQEIQSEDQYDLVISNPPYIPVDQLPTLPQNVKKEPRLALDGGEDGLCYIRFLIQNAHKVLNQDGYLIIEIGDGQDQSVRKLVKESPFYGDIKFIKDYTGTQRIISMKVSANG